MCTVEDNNEYSKLGHETRIRAIYIICVYIHNIIIFVAISIYDNNRARLS